MQRTLPFLDAHGARARLILGTAWGERAPVTMQSEIFYADVVLAPGAQFPMPDDHEDRVLYITEGAIEIAGESYEAGRIMVFRPGDRISRAGRRKGRPTDGAGRRDTVRPALHLVELRLILARKA
jgi:redox-sensitive bicupin YhaK (pirin superfamily)